LELGGCAILELLVSDGKDQNHVTLDDGVDPVSNDEDGRAYEGLFHYLLDLLLSLNVDVGSGLVQDDDLVPSQDCSTDAKELLLSSTQTGGIQLEVESTAIISAFPSGVEFSILHLLGFSLALQEGFQASVFENLRHMSVLNSASRI